MALTITGVIEHFDTVLRAMAVATAALAGAIVGFAIATKPSRQAEGPDNPRNPSSEPANLKFSQGHSD